jgi:hypothetical protein
VHPIAQRGTLSHPQAGERGLQPPAKAQCQPGRPALSPGGVGSLSVVSTPVGIFLPQRTCFQALLGSGHFGVCKVQGSSHPVLSNLLKEKEMGKPLLVPAHGQGAVKDSGGYLKGTSPRSAWG